MVRCSMGPRHDTAVWSSTNIPIEITFTPCATGGRIISPTWVGVAPAMPSRPGIENPNTSASMSPTRSPRSAIATARLAVRVDLPTPPFPLVIA